MTLDIWIVFTTLIISFVLFATDWIRYDIVALMALLSVTLAGIISPETAFSGFSEPAVIVVAGVLVVSRGIYKAGVADLLSSILLRSKRGIMFQLGVTNGIVGSLSGFMSNTGTLALFLPIIMQIARKRDRSPSLFLMPLAASALLGGLVTLIGTPPNLIIASYRGQISGENFSMFDFTPVGLGVAVAGIAFICLIGWRFVPKRQAKENKEQLFDIEAYIAEVSISEDSEFAGAPIETLEETLEEDIVVGSIIRDGETIEAPSKHDKVRAGDRLLIQIDPDYLDGLLEYDLTLTSPIEEDGDGRASILESDEVKLIEAVIMANSTLVNKQIGNTEIRWRHGVNLLAVARQDERIQQRLEDIKLQAGDIILLQGEPNEIDEAIHNLGCIRLKERDISFNQKRELFTATGIFIATLIIVATGVLAVEVAFITSAVLMIITGLLSLEDAYDAINWPILILIGAMLPLGEAFETSGGAEVISSTLLTLSAGLPAVGTLVILFVTSMLLSNIVHNAAVATLFAPIAVSLAQSLGVSTDTFLMALAVSASATFLTPIGHQANTIVMEVGGYKFRDYWRLGLPLSILVIVIAIPLIVIFWPLNA